MYKNIIILMYLLFLISCNKDSELEYSYKGTWKQVSDTTLNSSLRYLRFKDDRHFYEYHEYEYGIREVMPHIYNPSVNKFKFNGKTWNFSYNNENMMLALNDYESNTYIFEKREDSDIENWVRFINIGQPAYNFKNEKDISSIAWTGSKLLAWIANNNPDLYELDLLNEQIHSGQNLDIYNGGITFGNNFIITVGENTINMYDPYSYQKIRSIDISNSESIGYIAANDDFIWSNSYIKDTYKIFIIKRDYNGNFLESSEFDSWVSEMIWHNGYLWILGNKYIYKYSTESMCIIETYKLNSSTSNCSIEFVDNQMWLSKENKIYILDIFSE